jgi:hypothetical protein
MWTGVRGRFRRFLANIALTPDQVADGNGKAEGVHACLRAHYYGNPALSVGHYAGSWDKSTVVRPPRDVDLYFFMPVSAFERFEQRSGNKQSQLLQEVKSVLQATYPNTDMRGDGQVVMVKFESYAVEVAPAFQLRNSQQVWICDTNNEGRYKVADPIAEVRAIDDGDHATMGNLRPLIRMLKTWQWQCNVPIKSFHLELAASAFLQTYQYRLEDVFYYDWMVRDFFDALRASGNHILQVPGIGEWVNLGNAWQARAESAYVRADKACDYERADMVVHAGEEWQRIFGTYIPLMT